MEEKRTNSMSFLNSVSDEDFLKILKENKTFKEIGKALGYKQRPGKNARDNIRNRAKKLGINLEQTVKVKKKNLPPQSIKRNLPRYCSCGVKISNHNKSGFCINCLKAKNNTEKIKHWKETGDTGCQVQSTLRNIIRTYIFEKQDKKCAICKMENMWNGKELHFILDHINGDASNNNEENLRLICPNCDSQLSTFKSKNKNSARNKFRQKK